jgi:uncharacterized C2H2 Zn-finger protein
VFQVTPFGLYCLVCKKKISADHSTNFSRHVKRFHAGYSGKTFKELQLEVQRISNSTMNDYCCIDTQKMMISCGVCGEIFSRPSNFERHIANAVKKRDQCAQARSVKKFCIKTICNRVVEDLSKEKEKEAVPKSSDLLSFSAIALIIKPFVREDESPQRYISIFQNISEIQQFSLKAKSDRTFFNTVSWRLVNFS